MKRSFFMLLLISIAAFSFAQDRKISGTLIDKDTKEPLPQVTLQLLKTDSSFVGGTVSADDGRFSLAAPKNGKYLLKISSIGYVTSVKNLEVVDNKNLAMGTVTMSADAVMLKGTEVTALAQKRIAYLEGFEALCPRDEALRLTFLKTLSIMKHNDAGGCPLKK